MNALVSIIIPAFNRAHLIARTLDSISAQTYANWECIVVDDGSRDSTTYVVNSYVIRDSRFKLYKRPSNMPKGANACRNYGLLKARGVYINWFDSDDLMMPCKLTIQVNQLEHSAFNYAICQTEYFDLNANKLLGLRCEHIHSNDVLNDYITFKIFWMTGSPLWRKKFLESNNFTFNEKLQQSQDYDYHIHIIAKDDSYAVTDQPLMKLIKHDSNMSASIFDNVKKFKSNLIVRFITLKRYHQKLSTDTKLYLLNYIFNLYRFMLQEREFYKAFICLRFLASSIYYVDSYKGKKLLYLLNWTVALPSFMFLKRGDFLLRRIR